MPNNSEGGVEKLTEEKHEVTSNFNIIQICNTDWFFLLKHPSDKSIPSRISYQQWLELNDLSIHSLASFLILVYFCPW